MEDFEVNFSEDADHTAAVTTFSKPVFKKWFKAGGNAGFLSIEPWLSAQKFVIDIGKVDPTNNSVVSSTKCYVNAIQLVTYLQAIQANRAAVLYPKRSDCPSPESLCTYGGSNNVARVFKIHWWGAKADSDGDANGFAWKCGHFEGETTPTGAIKPKYNNMLSADLIKVTRLEMNEIAVRTTICLNGYAARNDDWYG